MSISRRRDGIVFCLSRRVRAWPCGRAVMTFTAQQIRLPEEGKQPADARTIDVSRRGWGHNVEIMRVLPEDRLEVAGWLTPLPNEGDYLILANGSDTTRYQIDTIRCCGNPPDMFFATLSFAPRQAEASHD